MWLPPLLPPALHPLRAIAFDTLLAAARALPGTHLLESNNRPASGIPVFVMMPLDFACATPRIPACELENALSLLAHTGVHGVMVDVWWGLCEPRPREYSFELYGKLAAMCEKLGLKMQATMCFHACGGNVGDDVNIPLPDWVVAAADAQKAWFRDRSQALASGSELNREYISFGADHLAFLPGGKQTEKPVQGVVPPGGVPAPRSSATDPSSSGLAGLIGKFEDPPSSSPHLNGAEPTPASAAAPKNIGTSSAAQRLASNGVSEGLRTPLRAYADFIEAFIKYMSGGKQDYMGSIITELQVGVGPCGELRYPSYPMTAGKWKFPGIGEFQSYDPHLLRQLAAAAREQGPADGPTRGGKWLLPPDGAGSYNDTPFDTTFFRRGFKSAHGKFFQEWYSRVLLRHCDDMLTNVRAILPPDSHVALAVKISGIHWWYWTSSRAAESTAGYYVAKHYSFYEEAARLFKAHEVVFDFTCLEMRTVDQPFLTGRAGPKQLVREVFRIAAREGVVVAGENALERYDWPAYRQIVKAFRWTNATAHGFTLLRLTPALLVEEHLENLDRLTTEMSLLKRRG